MTLCVPLDDCETTTRREGYQRSVLRQILLPSPPLLLLPPLGATYSERQAPRGVSGCAAARPGSWIVCVCAHRRLQKGVKKGSWGSLRDVA